jgi:RNA polymerase sigma-54 factor
MMHMEQHLSQTQRQEMRLNQRMQQALHILQLSTMELEEYLQQEVEVNPFLELIKTNEQSFDALEVPESAQKSEDPPESMDVFAKKLGVREDPGTSDWDQRLGKELDFSVNPDLDEKRRYYEESITRNESLSEHLLKQLRVHVEDPTDYAIGERIIIGEIDDKGYFRGDINAIAAEMNVPPERVESVLKIIQTFDPVGVGARNVAECLLLQIEVYYPEEEELKTLVREHLEALGNRQIQQIAKRMKVTPERIEELRQMLRTLTLWPGYEYSPEPPPYVIPDVIVEKEDGEFVVRLTEDASFELRVSEDYHENLVKQAHNKQEKEFIRTAFDRAKWIKHNIEHRKQTILKVAQAIVAFQREFLEKGIDYIKPLTLQDVANVVGVHESTVARATRGKYIQTPQGLFEMKYFFSTGLKTKGGGEQSNKSVQAMVKRIIDEEDKREPLSDQKIADILNEQGLNIARRTVAKYREALKIPPAHMRKSFH